MKKIMVTIVAAMTAVAGIVPAQAAPLAVSKSQVLTQADVQSVQYRRDDRRRGWHNGYRGYEDRRPGYRQSDDGWWYPLAAFGAGAILGGAIGSQQPQYREPLYREPQYRPAPSEYSSAHVDWCLSRYRSYRPYDNTYVPRAGVRAQCMSPYY
ncbi:BA14K family protein [Ensifer canadensis]